MSDDESITYTITKKDFTESVKEYINIFDRLAEIRKDVAMLNKRKKKLSEVIVAYMKSNEKEYCNLGEKGSLEIKQSKSKLALKKEDIERLLQELGTDETKSKETAEFLMANKTIVERNTLKRNIKPLD
uniref:Uncharacterized protein n=1 Tax=viral metagenome TaxID=1070528 RepID=A0A6C0F7Q0_9ZZZZ|tara:strand:+ start:6351 stop:6737 length:387 start_codon:yes stop_codon:yes gene_type:complete